MLRRSRAMDGGKTPAPFAEDEVVPSSPNREPLSGDPLSGVPIVDGPVSGEHVEGDMHFHDQADIEGLV